MTTTEKRKSANGLPQKMESWERPVPFTEDFKWPGGRTMLTFTTESYMTWVQSLLSSELLQLQPIISLSRALETDGEEGRSYVRVGDKFVFHMKKFPMVVLQRPVIGNLPMFLSPFQPRPTRAQLGIYRGNSKASVAFSDCVNIPVLTDKDANPWMSLTPNEVLTQRGQLRRARKHTAIAGLGLGWVVRRVLERKSVTRVTVVEQNADIIHFFGLPLQQEFGDRLEIVHASAYDHDWSGYDVSLWDIWEKLGGASWDSKFQAIKKQLLAIGKVCVGWGDNRD